MNKTELVIGIACLNAFGTGGTLADALQPADRQPYVAPVAALGDTVRISLARSTVQWKGTKMRGAGKHEGVVPLQRAFLLRRGGQLVGGSFMLDMRSIRVTDIPAYEPIPLRNLTNHLKGPDFLAVDQYPTARFVVNRMEQTGPGAFKVTGALTLKGITQNIAFTARQAGKTVSSTFSLNRFQWNIAYKGSWAADRLVDDNIELTIKLQLI